MAAQQINHTPIGGYHCVSELVKPGVRIYEQRACIYKALNEIDGVSAVKPKAAFYILPKFDIRKFNIKDDERVGVVFLRKKKIFLVHGREFKYPQPDHGRIVYLPTVKELTAATNALSDFLSDYSQV